MFIVALQDYYEHFYFNKFDDAVLSFEISFARLGKVRSARSDGKRTVVTLDGKIVGWIEEVELHMKATHF